MMDSGHWRSRKPRTRRFRQGRAERSLNGTEIECNAIQLMDTISYESDGKQSPDGVLALLHELLLLLVARQREKDDEDRLEVALVDVERRDSLERNAKGSEQLQTGGDVIYLVNKRAVQWPSKTCAFYILHCFPKRIQ